MSFTAKSVILDIADNWGNGVNLSIRSIEFFLKGIRYNLIPSDFTTYGLENATDWGYYRKHAFDTTLSKVGGSEGVEWITIGVTNIRLVCVFNNPIIFDEIQINNHHSSGNDENEGIKNTKIYISTDEITNGTYATPISNSILIFDGQFREHIASDIEDPETLILISPFIEETCEETLTIFDDVPIDIKLFENIVDGIEVIDISLLDHVLHPVINEAIEIEQDLLLWCIFKDISIEELGLIDQTIGYLPNGLEQLMIEPFNLSPVLEDTVVVTAVQEAGIVVVEV